MHLATQEAPTGWVISDHFLTQGGNDGWVVTSSGGSVNTNLATDADHPGIQTFSYVSASTDRASVGGPVNSIVLGGGSWFFQAVLRIETLSNVTDEYTMYFGLFDATTATPVDGVYFYYDRATAGDVWRIATANNSTITVNSLGNAVSAGTWVRPGIEINAAGTRAKYYIDGALLGTITTNLPAGRATGFATGFNKSAGSGAADVFSLDHLLIQHQRTNPAWTI
jgi:hypothetical protein